MFPRCTDRVVVYFLSSVFYCFCPTCTQVIHTFLACGRCWCLLCFPAFILSVPTALSETICLHLHPIYFLFLFPSCGRRRMKLHDFSVHFYYGLSPLVVNKTFFEKFFFPISACMEKRRNFCAVGFWQSSSKGLSRGFFSNEKVWKWNNICLELVQFCFFTGWKQALALDKTKNEQNIISCIVFFSAIVEKYQLQNKCWLS